MEVKYLKKQCNKYAELSTNKSFYRLRQANLYQYSTERLLLNIELARSFPRLSRDGVSRPHDAYPVMGYEKPPNCPFARTVGFHPESLQATRLPSRINEFFAFSDDFASWVGQQPVEVAISRQKTQKSLVLG